MRPGGIVREQTEYEARELQGGAKAPKGAR
jgi:hypothetical protein